MAVYYPKPKKKRSVGESIILAVVKIALFIPIIVAFWYVFVVFLIFSMANDNLKRKR